MIYIVSNEQYRKPFGVLAITSFGCNAAALIGANKVQRVPKRVCSVRDKRDVLSKIFCKSRFNFWRLPNRNANIASRGAESVCDCGTVNIQSGKKKAACRFQP
jgi:hypothetical protein